MGTFIGTIVEKDGMLCLDTGQNSWFPLGGNSGIAATFRESFNEPQRSDIGKRLYYVGGVLQMENTAQLEERQALEGKLTAIRGIMSRVCSNSEPDAMGDALDEIETVLRG